jgi:hypothetical protein
MRTNILATLLTIVSGSILAADGVNLPGHDYAHFSAPSVLACRNSCAGDSHCHAYTWVKPGLQGRDGVCWLKGKLPASVKDTCCDSATRDPNVRWTMRQEDGVNRPGADYMNYEARYWQDCEVGCTRESMCKSWTYVRAGVQGPKARCWLKRTVARPVADAHTISGVKYKPVEVQIDYGTELQPVSE